MAATCGTGLQGPGLQISSPCHVPSLRGVALRGSRPSVLQSLPFSQSHGAEPHPHHRPLGRALQQLALVPQRQTQEPVRTVTRVASAVVGGQNEDSNPDAFQMPKMLVLALMFVAWYGTSIWFNIYNKQLFAMFPFPLSATNCQFAIGTIISLLFWATGTVKAPKLDANVLKSIYPLAAIHVVGNVLTNVSLGLVSVSFTHTVKAAEPFFSVLFSSLFLGTIPTLPVVASLVPIVAGVVLASVSEASFNWPGFLSAIASNITFQSRNVLSKKLMITKGSLDSANMFQIITIMSFFMLLPFTLGLEFTPAQAALSSLSANPASIEALVQRLLAAGVCFHSYQMLSYSILSKVAPVTHSIGNCVKRVVVIVASLIIFQNPISTQNAAGTAIALFGVFLYSQAKRLGKKDKTSEATASTSE